jgi:hypothetical protein
VTGKVNGDQPVRGDDAIGDEIPPASVARQPVERQDRGLATGIVPDGQRQPRSVDLVLIDVMRH